MPFVRSRPHGAFASISSPTTVSVTTSTSPRSLEASRRLLFMSGASNANRDFLRPEPSFDTPLAHRLRETVAVREASENRCSRQRVLSLLAARSRILRGGRASSAPPLLFVANARLSGVRIRPAWGAPPAASTLAEERSNMHVERKDRVIRSAGERDERADEESHAISTDSLALFL